MAFPSTFLDIQNAVIVKARLDPVNDLQKVKDWINQTYSRVCVETEATVVSATMTVTPGAASYTFPTAVARIKQMVIQPYGSTQFNDPLISTTLDEILQRRQYGGDTLSYYPQSTHYAVVGINDFELWRTPSAADTILIWYVAFPTALSANTDVPILAEPYASKLLEYGALVDAGDLNGDPGTAGWQADFQDWLGRYQNHLEQKRGEQPGQFHQWGSGVWSSEGAYVGY